jgi:hypothetical protein
MKDLEKALKEKLVENGASADWLDKHLEVIDYTDSKPSNKPIILPSEIWVELYGTLANYIHEYASLDPIWIIDENGNEVRTEEKQDEFMDIVDEVENIMRQSGLEKEE